MENNAMPSNEELVRQVRELSETVQTLKEAQARLVAGPVRSRAGSVRRVTALLTLIAVVGTVAVTSLVSADSPPKPGEVVPRQLPYRGYLEKDGMPEEGTRAMVFDLYKNAVATSGETSLFKETRQIPVSNGIFSVDLGDCNPAGNCLGSLATALKEPMLYLAITVDGQLLQGRQRVMSSAYAQRAAYASGAEGALKTSFDALSVKVQQLGSRDLLIGPPTTTRITDIVCDPPWVWKTIDAGPAITVKPTVSGTYRIYGSIYLQNYPHSTLGSGGVTVGIVQTANTAQILADLPANFGTPAAFNGDMNNNHAGSLRPELIVALTAGQEYTFKIHLKSYAKSHLEPNSVLVAERIQ